MTRGAFGEIGSPQGAEFVPGEVVVSDADHAALLENPDPAARPTVGQFSRVNAGTRLRTKPRMN